MDAKPCKLFIQQLKTSNFVHQPLASQICCYILNPTTLNEKVLIYFNDLVNKALLKKLVMKNNLKPSFNHNIELTEREQEVLKMICEEKTAAEIGKEIFLSPRSVEGIRTRLIEKVGVRNTAGLVMFAVKNGLAN